MILNDYKIISAPGREAALSAFSAANPDLVLVEVAQKGDEFFQLTAELLEREPALPVILLTDQPLDFTPQEAIRLGVVDLLLLPLSREGVRAAVKSALKRSKQWENWVKTETKAITGPLLQRVDELEEIFNVGRSLTSKLDLDSVLTEVVDAAVRITGAEEGHILLLDEKSGELYMRAARNFQEEFVRTFRLPVDDTYAGQVVQTGKPLFLNTEDPQKIKTSYLVYSIVYVPLIYHERTIGVLGVDNRESGKSFENQHVTALSTMAQYAAIAIENAKLYSLTESERKKLDAILTQIEDGVIVIDEQGCILMVNHVVRQIFALGNEDLTGKKFDQVFTSRDLLIALRGEALNPERIEVRQGDQSYYRAQVTDIPGVGKAVALHDISYLKELDKLKTDFVNTISHDLRTPLTSIMGYVELIKRSGEVNEQQVDYIQRVQASVHHITSLISEVLTLGKVEISLDANFKDTQFLPIINEAITGCKLLMEQKNQKLELDLPRKLPDVFGDPVQLRQMVENLLGNAIKYTDLAGTIGVRALEDNGQFILQVKDNGRGIPLEDQPKIFERFYRAANVSEDTQGTGLGLAITKSIVDNHRGRIWVDSKVGKGSIFTIVLPLSGMKKD